MSILHFRFFLLSLVLVAGGIRKANAQEEDNLQQPFSNIDPEDFSPKTLQMLLVQKINAYRLEQGLDSLVGQEIAEKASADHSKFMAKIEQAVTEVGGGKKKDTGSRVKYYGGSHHAKELVAKANIAKGRDPFTYDKVADEVVQKWISNKRDAEVLADGGLVFASAGAALDQEGKRVYVSVVFGAYDMLNQGAAKKEELSFPYSTKKYGLKAGDERSCRTCGKFQDLQDLQKGLSIEGSTIYFEYDNLKLFKRMIRHPKDGLAVDIVQKEQYPCDKPYNIIDHDQVNKGVMLKRMYANKLYKRNEIKDRKANKIRVPLATLPANFDNPDIELNLMVIIDKMVCANITRKFMAESGVESVTPLHMIPDTVFVATDGVYKLAADKTVLNFKIPFDKNKAEYKPEDIKAFIASLNEPDFIVKELEIYAYSSIEGDSLKNAKLQQKRAESIVSALEKLQKGHVKRTIITSDSWSEFKKQVKGGPYEYLAKMTREQASKEISDNRSLLKNLEPILQEERYAQILMTIEYNIQGKNEQPYVISKFAKALKNNDPKLATALQNFMIQKMMMGRYTEDAISATEIPHQKEFAHLINNQIWFENLQVKDTLDASECGVISELAKLSPADLYIAFNRMVCAVKNDPISDETHVRKMQEEIDKFYKSDIQKDDIDALNLEFRFKVIETFDSLEGGQPIVEESIDKIKEVFNIREATWQNALKLAVIFVEQRKNYEYALKLLDPFVVREQVDERLLQTFISLCTYVPERLNSPKLRQALVKLHEMDPKAYCELIDRQHHSFQIFDNPGIKEDYCKICGKN
ncbi:MAG: hypothetical protein H6585_04150 [Flavobacteriales bacterium]|nr:hypothetical protein [Flavobacteriales bacterium]MCB9447517.1 hypothetical protein [Flavobacteriales bacterium]